MSGLTRREAIGSTAVGVVVTLAGAASGEVITQEPTCPSRSVLIRRN